MHIEKTINRGYNDVKRIPEGGIGMLRELNHLQKQTLEKMFGDRVTFEERERRFYAYDVGTMPAMMKKFAGSNLPVGVVQPADQEELVQLMHWAQANRVALTPRGKATSGYGGAVPTQAGLVVESNRMKRILEINEKEKTVRVQAGVVWEKLEDALNRKGLTLNSYPTSAPASTVAGWLATGGAGIGSYQAGYFRESIIEITMVLPDGTIKKLSGADLALVENASGITGFITELTFKVAPLAIMEKQALAFTDLQDLSDFIKAVYKQKIELWSLSFINPEIARYRNKMPVKEAHGGGQMHAKINVPEKFILMAVYKSANEVNEKLNKLSKKYKAERLNDEIAGHEWQERFNPMKAKRISPSLIPAEVVVPVEKLEHVLRDFNKRVKLPLLLEGFGIKDGEIVLLGFIPHDERKFGFNVAFGLSLSVLKTALKHGGRAYGCGLYFSSYAETLLGKATIDKLVKFKKAHDPQHIMNPDKTVEKQTMARMIQMALPFEGMIAGLSNRFPGNPPAEKFAPIKDLPGDVSWFTYSCAQCGYCVDECDQYYGRGWESQSPRGKWSLLKMVANGEAKLTQQDVDTFLACTTCEICNERCQLELPIEPSWLKLRGQLINEEGFRSLPAFHIMEASAKKEWNIWAHYAEERDAWLPDDLRAKIKDKSEYAYFPGCTASYVEKDIAESTARLLDKAGVGFTYLGKEEACCGIPMLMAGRWDTFEEIMNHNLEAMEKHGASTIITSCPACRLIWDTYYKRWTEDRGKPYPYRAKHYSEVIAEKIADGSFKLDNNISGTITYHDPCHMGRASGVYEEPRTLLQAIPGIDYREMNHSRENAHCCGSVMSLVADPDAAGRIGKVRLEDACEVGADTIITACPCCRVQLQVSTEYNGMENIKIRDLATFVAEAAGMEIPDSQPEIDSSWATFDVMIRMMTPRGMAEMMAEMLDDMIDAMPGPMAGMMKWMKGQKPSVKAPMIAMMRPMMPKLFPLLLPGMMPKVMPKMLDKVKEKVPMPEFMAEQMPDLMPPAMVELMPKMLPDIIPHFMPLMIAYLKQ